MTSILLSVSHRIPTWSSQSLGIIFYMRLWMGDFHALLLFYILIHAWIIPHISWWERLYFTCYKATLFFILSPSQLRPAPWAYETSSCFVVHEMSTGSATIDPASIAFCPADCDTIFISSMESNAGLLCDRREVYSYALDLNPTFNCFIANSHRKEIIVH